MIGVFLESLANLLALLAGFGGGMYLLCEVAQETTGRTKALATVGGLLCFCVGYAWIFAMLWAYL